MANNTATSPRKRTDLPIADPFRPRGTPRKSRRGVWRAGALVAVHLAILVHIAHWKLAGSTLSPVEPSEAMETLELGYVNAGFILLCGLILLTLVFGRFFCGWACHVVAYQDLCAWLLGKVGLRPRPVRSRLLVWIPACAAFYMFAWPTLHRWWSGGTAPELTWQLTTDDFWATFPGPWVSVATFGVCGFLVVYWLGAKGFCSYGCPYGALFGISDRAAPGRIRVTDACETCGHCTATCTSNVRVHEEVARFGMVVDTGCMKCMDCVSVCPKQALYYGFGTPSGIARGAGRRRADFSWGEELLMLGVFAVALFAFRSLYGVVPFLLAIGLSVLAAVFGLVAWRLVRRPDVAVQNRVLKAGGSWTRRGIAASVFAALALGLVGHSGAVQLHLHRGEALAHRGADRSLSTTERRASLDDGIDHLQTAARIGLAEDPRVEQLLGLALRERGDYAPAEAHLRAALALRPGWPAAAVPLTDLLALRSAWGEAEQILRDLLATDPDLQPARARLERLTQRAGK